MFKKIFVIPAFILVILFLGYSIYSNLISNQESVQETTIKRPERLPVKNTKQVDNKSVVESDKSVVDTVKNMKYAEKPGRVENTQQQKEPDWTDIKPVVKTHTSDPFKDHLKIEQAKKDGSWMIGDPAKMDPEDFHKAVRQQMINRFGDIPEVHAMMDYGEKQRKGIQITLDDRIEGMRATASLFPSETNRKTLAYYEWMRTKGTEYKTDFTAEDYRELQSIGINVKTEKDSDGGVHVSFTTK